MRLLIIYYKTRGHLRTFADLALIGAVVAQDLKKEGSKWSFHESHNQSEHQTFGKTWVPLTIFIILFSHRIGEMKTRINIQQCSFDWLKYGNCTVLLHQITLPFSPTHSTNKLKCFYIIDEWLLAVVRGRYIPEAFLAVFKQPSERLRSKLRLFV